MSRSKGIWLARICEVCQKPFEIPLYRAKHPERGRFCTRVCQSAWQLQPLAVRFQRYVGMATASGCLLWTGSTHEFGYGIMKTGGRKGRNAYAHRIAWELVNGPILDGLWVLHNCPGGDNPACVNLAHLWLGTHADNMADMTQKGRQVHGEQCSFARHTAATICAIRVRYAQGGVTQRQLASEFGVPQSMISRIVQRKIWQHVD